MNFAKCKIIFSIIIILLFGSIHLYAAEISVSAAISLTAPFNEIRSAFEREHPSHNVQFNFASSGQLKKQIEMGAMVDVFASASTADVESLRSAGLTIDPTERIFARNSLVIISKEKVSGVKSLLDGDIRKISIGNPKTVPAGKYAKEALSFYGLYDKLKGKLVYAENVRQVYDYVARGSADAGLVYLSDTVTFLHGGLKVFRIDKGAHGRISYPIVVIAGAKDEAASRSFVAFVASEKGASILGRYGFNVNTQGK